MGFVFGGGMALILVGIYFMAGSGDFYLFGEIGFAKRPVLFLLAMGATIAFGLGAMFYGFRTLSEVNRTVANLEPLHEMDQGTTKRAHPVVRVLLALLGIFAMAIVFTPAVASFGRPVAFALFAIGIMALTIGLVRSSYLIAGMGFGMKVAAGLGLWLVEN